MQITVSSPFCLAMLSALKRHESRDVPPDDAAGHRGRGSRPHFGRPCRRVAPRQRPDSGSFHETGLKRPSRVVPERFELFDADGLIGGPSNKKARLSVPCGRESRLSNDSLGNGSSRGKREKDGAKSIASSSSERLELFRLAESQGLCWRPRRRLRELHCALRLLVQLPTAMTGIDGA